MSYNFGPICCFIWPLLLSEQSPISAILNTHQSIGRAEEMTRRLGFTVYKLVRGIKHRCRVSAFKWIDMQILVFIIFFTVSPKIAFSIGTY